MAMDWAPVMEAAASPISRYPAWAMELYASIRLRLVWVIAARLPTVMVSAAITPITWGQGTSESTVAMSGDSPLVESAPKKIRTASAKPAALGPTERKAVNGVGAPSYTSGHHMCQGTEAIL